MHFFEAILVQIRHFGFCMENGGAAKNLGVDTLLTCETFNCWTTIF